MPANRGRGGSSRSRNTGGGRTRTNRSSRYRSTRTTSPPKTQSQRVAPSGPAESVTGVLKLTGRDRGELIDLTILYPTEAGVYVGPNMIRQYRLTQGATLVGQAQKAGDRFELTEVETICGVSPEDYNRRAKFKELIPIDPQERINLSRDGNITMRVVDLVAPIGKGTRALIVSPPTHPGLEGVESAL